MHAATSRLLSKGGFDPVLVARMPGGQWLVVREGNVADTIAFLREALTAIEIARAEAEKPAVLS